MYVMYVMQCNAMQCNAIYAMQCNAIYAMQYMQCNVM